MMEGADGETVGAHQDPEGTIELIASPELPGVELMDVKGVSRKWAYFHETYSFCVANRVEASSVPWKYRFRTHTTGPDGVQLMEPGEFHSNLWTAPRADFQVVFVSADRFSELVRQLGWQAPSRPHLRLAQLHGGRVADILRRLSTLLVHRGEVERVECGLAALAKTLSDAGGFECRLPSSPRHRARRAASNARDLIQAAWNEPLPMSAVTACAGVPLSTLERAFQDAFGTTPRQYQLHVRLMRAKQLLQSQDHPIALVAGRCGIRDPKYFARLFRREFGCSPLAYQTRVRR